MLVSGMVPFGAHEMSQKDAQRIEGHTGDNLQQSCAAAAPDTAAAPAGGSSDYNANLERLASLREALLFRTRNSKQGSARHLASTDRQRNSLPTVIVKPEAIG
jgi:hypothetical protein